MVAHSLPFHKSVCLLHDKMGAWSYTSDKVGRKTQSNARSLYSWNSTWPICGVNIERDTTHPHLQIVRQSSIESFTPCEAYKIVIMIKSVRTTKRLLYSNLQRGRVLFRQWIPSFSYWSVDRHIRSGMSCREHLCCPILAWVRFPVQAAVITDSGPNWTG